MARPLSLLRGATRLVPRTPRGWDVVAGVAAAALFAVAWPTLFLTHDVPRSLAPVVAALAVLPLALVRVSPTTAWGLTALAAGGVGLVLDPAAGYGFPWQPTHVIALLVTLAALTATRPHREVALAWAGTVVLVVAFMPAGLKAGWTFGVTMVVLSALLLRALLLSRRQLARQQQVSEGERARRAVLEERGRIARDLHDVVAHRMSMVVVQAQSASRRLDGVPDHVAEEFDAIGVQARAALNEVRGMLGVLRSDGQAPEEQPQPGLGDLEALLVATRDAGVEVTWSLDGDLTDPGGAAGMVVYRVLQESLANASRHAPGAAVRVVVERGRDGVRCTVRNPAGPSAPGPAPAGHGSGLEGMATRARAVGGTVSTGPAEDGDWAVTLWVPLAEDPSTSAAEESTRSQPGP